MAKAKNAPSGGSVKEHYKREISDVTEEIETETRGSVEGQVQIDPNTLGTLKVSLWSKMGGFFRNGVRIGVGAVAGAGVAHLAASIIASSSLPLAVAQVASFAAATITAGGVGLAVLGIGAITAGTAAIVRAVNKNYRDRLHQKALIKKLAKEFKRGKNHKLDQEQIKLLSQAMDNKKMRKLIDKIDKRNPGFKDKLDEAIKNGYTNFAPQPARGLFSVITRIFRRTRNEKEEYDRVVELPPREPTPEERERTYNVIRSKTIFGANLSAREWLALQQIYNAEMKALRADIRKLSKIENPTPAQQKELAEKMAMEKKITNLEERAFRAAKKAAQAEAADNNNSLSAEERAIFQDFAEKGRRSTEAKKVVTEDDRKRAVEGVATYTRLSEQEPKKSKPKSGAR